MSRTQRLSILVLIACQGVCGAGRGPHSTVRESLHYSCLDDPFLSVTASTPKHDAFVDMDLRLTDPAGRTVGSGTHVNAIPRSSYGRIVALPSHREIPSKAIAVEVCSPQQGIYSLRVAERQAGEYRLTVQGVPGSGGKSSTAQPYHLKAETGRACEYKFRYSVVDGRASVYFLDLQGNPLLPGMGSPPCTTARRA